MLIRLLNLQTLSVNVFCNKVEYNNYGQLILNPILKIDFISKLENDSFNFESCFINFNSSLSILANLKNKSEYFSIDTKNKSLIFKREESGYGLYLTENEEVISFSFLEFEKIKMLYIVLKEATPINLRNLVINSFILQKNISKGTTNF
jgi:hypothetical protein